MRLSLTDRLGRQYDQGTLYDILKQVEQQGNDLADGRISARDGAQAAIPTLGNYVKGDIIWNSAPTETSNAVTGESYIIVGWECTTSGTPGTWKELRALTGAGGFLATSKITASLGADVNLNVGANYFDGPSMAQGTSGTWLVFGQVSVQDLSGATSNIYAKLWDGTTVINSGAFSSVSPGSCLGVIALAGVLASPAGNLRISCRAPSGNGRITFNTTGLSKDCTITAIRIG